MDEIPRRWVAIKETAVKIQRKNGSKAQLQRIWEAWVGIPLKPVPCLWVKILQTKWVWSFMDYFFEFRPILGPLISKFLSIGIQKNFLRFPTKFRLELRHFLKFNFTFKVWIKLFTKKGFPSKFLCKFSLLQRHLFFYPTPPSKLKINPQVSYPIIGPL